jgi:O-antigen/teichoic acid export membrane protein
VINKGLIFLILPFLTYYLVPSQYAIYSLLMFFAALVSMFYQFGLQQSLMTLYHRQQSKTEKYKLVTTTYLTIFCIAIVGSLLLLLWRQPLLKLILDLPSIQSYDNLFIITVIFIVIDLFTAVTLILLNIRHDSKHFSHLALTKNLVFLLLVIIGAVTQKLTLFYLFASLLVAALISAVQAGSYFSTILIELKDTTRQIKLFSIPILKEILRFGIYMLPATFAILILQTSDRYMLNLLSPNKLQDVGIYAAAYKIGMIMSLLTGIFDLVFFPYILKHAESDRVKIMLRRLFQLYNMIGGAIALLIILFSSEIFLILDPNYALGGKIVFFSVISMFLRGIFNLINLGFYILKRSKSIALGVILGAIANLLLNYFLIPEWGMFGAGFASILAYMFIVFFNYLAVQKAFPVEYNFWFLAVSLVILAAAAWVNYHPISWQLITIKIFLSAVIGSISLILILRSAKFEKLKQILMRKETEN